MLLTAALESTGVPLFCLALATADQLPHFQEGKGNCRYGAQRCFTARQALNFKTEVRAAHAVGGPRSNLQMGDR
jgi:hypothetical protein